MSDRFDALLLAQEAARRLTHDATQSEELARVRQDGTIALSLLAIAQDMRQIRTTLQELAPREGSPIRSLWIRVRR